MEPSAHILVVDDHREIRDLLAKYLARHEFRVSTAESAAKARRLLEASAIDLVVLDIMMPGEDGLVALPPAARDDRAAGHHADRDGRGHRPGGRARDGRRRLRRQAVQPARAAGPDQGRAAPRQQPAAAAPAGSTPEPLRFDRWLLDVARRELVGEDGVAVPLSTAEFLLLSALLDHPRMVLEPRPAARPHPRPQRRRRSTAASTTRSAGCARRSRPIPRSRP